MLPRVRLRSIDGVLARLALSEWMLKPYADERLRNFLLSQDPRIRRGKGM